MVHPFGLVTYREGKDKGTLIAEWINDDPNSLESEIGIGMATVIKAGSYYYEGEYRVEYWLSGEVIKLDLSIKRNGPIYDMAWARDGETLHTGYGFISGDMLVAGFERQI